MDGSFSLSYLVQLKSEDLTHYPWKFKILEKNTYELGPVSYADIAAREGRGGTQQIFIRRRPTP